ncbi:MAG TPA: TonB-dependent receptor [Pyrinomonadaceae bacterium]
MTSCRLQLLFVRCCLLFALCLLPVAFTSAQSTSATLSGTVTDPNSAAVVGAQVTVTNNGTGLKRQATTSGSGAFTIPLLPPSTYTVLVENQGFTPAEIKDVVLNVNANVSLNIELKVGAVGATVDVKSEAPLINESPTVGTVVDRQFVENLPLNGRSFQSLITLTPGTVLTRASAEESGQFSVNGQRPNANYFTVDGVSANIGVSISTSLFQSGGSSLALSAAGGTNSLVSVDALQEFRVLTSTYAPEFGRTPGGQVQIVTRSGTNQFSGTLFEYFRNDALDANDWFANSRGLPKPALRQNDFGGVLGGPLYLPRFGEGGPALYDGENRTFFFFSYEGLRLRQPLTRITDVPTLCLRGLGSCGAGQSAAPAAIQPYLNAFPIPNGPNRVVGGVPNGLAEFAASFSNPSTLDATSIRVDHTLNDRVTVFGRYNYAPSGIDERGGVSSNSLSTVAQTKFNTQTLTLSSTQTFTPSVSNDLRFNYSKTRTNTFLAIDNFGGAAPPSDSLLFPSFVSRQNASFGFFVFNGTGTNFRAGQLQKNSQEQFNLVDNLSFIAGSHQLKFGIDYRRIAPVRGGRTYDQLSSSPTVAPLLLGNVSSVSILQLRPNLGYIFDNFSAYGQDIWKVTPRLTLTYGLRWELNPPPSVTNADPPFALTGVDNPATLAFAPRGTPLYKTTYNNFAPRIGVAYQLFQKQGRETMLRGGFGIFYDLGNAAAGGILNTFPYLTNKRLTNVPFPLDEASAMPAPFTTNLPVTGIVTGFDPNLKLPRIFQWNLSVEQSIGSSQTVSASYVAAVGRRLIRQDVFFGPNPNFSNAVILIRDTATSDYHAMQLQFQRRLSNGLQALASYTWSHSIDEASGDTNTAGFDPGRASSDFDIRHSFSSAITYNIPTLSSNALGRAVLGGWSLDTILIARSAAPVNVIATQVVLPTGFFNIRPNLIQGVPLYINDPTAPGGRRINNSAPTAAQVAAAVCRPITPTNARGAFCTPPIGLQGNLGRNALRGFSIWQADLALRRQFKLRERLNLQFRAEFFNVFNHPNFGDPSNFQGNFLPNALFGQSISMFGRSVSSGGGAGLNPLYQIGGPRSIQLAVKIQF